MSSEGANKQALVRFLTVAFLIAFLLVGGVVGVNWYLDPYGVRPNGARLRANLDSRPAERYDDPLHKAYALPNAKAQAVYFGSSRTCLGLPPDSDQVAQPAYNCGLLGADTREMLAFVRHAIAVGDMKTAYIGIDLERLLRNPKTPQHAAAPFTRDYLLQRRGEFMRPAFFSPAIFSLDAFKESLKIVRGSAPPKTSFPGGLCDESIVRWTIKDDSVLTAENYFAEKDVEENLVRLAHDEAVLDAAGLSDIREMVAACKKAGVEVVLFAQPINPLYLKKVEEIGTTKYLARPKEAIAKILQEELPADKIRFFDFATDNKVADDLAFESPGSKVWKYWWDALHYRPSF